MQPSLHIATWMHVNEPSLNIIMDNEKNAQENFIPFEDQARSRLNRTRFAHQIKSLGCITLFHMPKD